MGWRAARRNLCLPEGWFNSVACVANPGSQGYHRGMSRIRRLDASVINQIAAGEVIERPASAVKELLENAIDALATRIDVDIVAGGIELIRIVDNGEGIHPEDLPLAVTSHATSKLSQASDLFRVKTFGFRGEALASLAEVSRLRIRSRAEDQPQGCELEVHYGQMGQPRPCGAPLGTLVEARQLFENLPVRRKFLKGTTTEFAHIAEQFIRVALAHPRLHLVLRHNEKMVYQLPPVDRPLERFTAIYGEELTSQLIGVESEHAGHRLWGYVGHPSLHKSSRRFQYFFLNGRWIQDRTLQYALTEAYRGLLMTGRYPVAFLFLEMPYDQVDVNVHPTKAEVRFRDTQQIFRQLLGMVRTRFHSLDLQSRLVLPASAPALSHESPFPQPNLPLQPSAAIAWGTPTSASPRSLEANAPAALAAQPSVSTEFAEWAKQELARWHPDQPAVFAEVSAPESEDSRSSSSPPRVEAVPEGQALGAHAPPSAGPNSLRSRSEPLRALQIHDCYLVVETEQGLTVIDQHALHERILYEQFRQRVLSGEVESQKLLMPVPIELTPRESAALLEHAAVLERLGIGVEEFGKDTVLLTKYPVLLGRVEFGPLLHDLAEKLDSKPTLDRRELIDELLHMMACKAAIKAGQRLSAEEIDALLQQRHLVDDAHHCPHGRPTALTLSRAELDRQFGRLG